MNLRRLIIRNVFRNKRRTALTIVSIGFSLFLLIALLTFLDILTNPPAGEESALRLAVRRSTAITEMVPISYEAKLKKVPHVVLVAPLQFAGGVYKDPKNFFANFATDSRIWTMFPELTLSDATRKAFASERIAAVAGEDLMRKFNWKVGDRITLTGTIFPVDLELKIVGTYQYQLGNDTLYFRYDYFNEALGGPDAVGAFWVKADRPESIPEIIDTVDGMFRNSAAETKTETEKAFVLNFVAMLGNVKMMVGSIATVVMFTMLLVAAGTMAMTVRERLREIAILKTLGYTPPLVLFLILGESIFISLLGFAVGCLLAFALSHSDVYAMTQGFIPVFLPPLRIYAAALAAGVGIGVFSGIAPAIQASRLTITEAMRRLE
jgi:putative ABC transport system permease protein